MFIKKLSIDGKCQEQWNLLKDKKIKGCTFMFSKGLEKVTVDKTFVESADCWQEFVSSLPENGCRYGIFDLELTVEDELTHLEYKGNKSNKLVFVCWTPVKAPVKEKMIAASSKEHFKRSFDRQFSIDWQFSDRTDLEIGERLGDLQWVRSGARIVSVK